MELPCRADPEKWFTRDRQQLGEAVHACRVHCPWLAQCAGERPAVDGVLAGVLYTRLAVPDAYQPAEVKCAVCAPPKPLHGTESGYGRHRRAKEPPCVPCRIAHNEGVRRSRKPKPPRPVDPPKDIYEERQRVLAAALKSA